MPSAGGVCPPVIIPLKENLKGKTVSNSVTVDTYIELATETTDCKIFFTTDGSKPLPYQSKYTEGKSTFVYKGPFTLKAGKRILKAVAVTRDGLKESDIVTRTFNVEKDSNSECRSSSSLADFRVVPVDKRQGKSHKSRPRATSTRPTRSSSSSSTSSPETVCSDGYDYNHNNGHAKTQRHPYNLNGPMYNNYLGSNEGIQASLPMGSNVSINPPNCSGTQINLWGFPPGVQQQQQPAWPAYNGMLPGSFYAPPYPALGYMTTKALEDLNRPKVPLAELKQIIREEGDRLLVQNNHMQTQWANQINGFKQQEPPHKMDTNEEAELVLSHVSPGNGDWQGQMNHILGHFKDRMNRDKNIQRRLAYQQLGPIDNVVLTENMDDDDEGNETVEIKMIFPVRNAQKRKPKVKPAVQPRPEIQPEVEKPTYEVKPIKPKIEQKTSKSSQDPFKKILTVNNVISKYKDVKSKIDSNFGKPITKHEKQKQEKEVALKKKDPFYETEEYQADGTLKPWSRFDAEEDCNKLRKAMKGLGTDETAIIDVLGYRGSQQRLEILKQFKTMFGKDLVKELESELSGKFLLCCKSLCMSPVNYDATELRKAIKGLGTDEDVLIEILCTRTNKQIKEIVTAYKQLFQKDLESDVANDTSGHFRRVLIAQLQANRSEDPKYDKTKVEEDASELIKGGQDKWGTDESVFVKILCERSFAHLRALFKEYKNVSKKNVTIQDAIKSEFSSDVQKALLTIVNVVEDKPKYFCEKLHKSMKGLGTNDDNLIRVVVSRCECDMVQIKQSFQNTFSKSLADWIKGDISGDYLNIVLALIGERPVAQPPPSKDTGSSQDNNVEDDNDAEEDDLIDVEEDEVKKQRDPTLLPVPNFDSKSDCEVLRKAMKGLGTDEDAIINVLSFRSMDQRIEIVKMFKTMFGKDLIKELKSELSGNFCHVMTSLCKTRAQFDADELRKAMKGLGTDEDCLIEILCSRNNEEIKEISSEYQQRHGKNLEESLTSETSSHLKRLFVSLVQCNRPTTTKISRKTAKKDAKSLLAAGEGKKFGTDESAFNVVLCSRSYAQLRATFDEYSKIAGKDIVDSIRSETSGDIRKAYITIVECIRDETGFFSNSLYDSMHGLGTKDDKLIRVVISRCEIDMIQIKTKFQQDYKQPLAQFIKDDTSGDYRKALLALIGEPSQK